MWSQYGGYSRVIAEKKVFFLMQKNIGYNAPNLAILLQCYIFVVVCALQKCSGKASIGLICTCVNN